MPNPGPSWSSCGTPGIRRSSRAPSSTTRTYGSGPQAASAAGGDRAAPCGGRSSWSSSLIRRPAASWSVPISETQSWPCCGARCGSQCAQRQDDPASAAADSTTIDRSRGLCRTAACETSQRAVASARSAGPGDAHDAEFGERQRHRHVVDGRRHRLRGVLGDVPLGLELDVGGQVADADPQPHRVRVGDPALPQPAPRAGGEQQHLGGVRVVGPPLALVADPGGLQLLLVLGEFGLVVLGLAAVLALALAVLAGPLADQHDRAHQAEQQHVDLVDHEVHRQAEGQRHHRGEHLEAGALALAGLLRHEQPHPRRQRPQPRRAVVRQAALAHGRQVRVGHARLVQDQHRVARLDLRAQRPGLLGVDRRVLQRHARARGADQRDPAVGADRDPGRRRGHRRVVYDHGAGAGRADGRGADAEAGHPAGPRARAHPQLVAAGGLAGPHEGADRVVDGDPHAVAQQGAGRRLRVAGHAVGPQHGGGADRRAGRRLRVLRAARVLPGELEDHRAAVPRGLARVGAQRAGQRECHVRGGRGVVRRDHHVVGVHTLLYDRHGHAHGLSPPRRARTRTPQHSFPRKAIRRRKHRVTPAARNNFPGPGTDHASCDMLTSEMAAVPVRTGRAVHGTWARQRGEQARG